MKAQEIITKYYSQEFQTYPCGPYPTKARTWDSLEEIQSEYDEFCDDCENQGQIALPLWVYVGEPAGDEERYGYPDYPDYVVDNERSERF